jgi:hypothetical protein
MFLNYITGSRILDHVFSKLEHRLIVRVPSLLPPSQGLSPELSQVQKKQHLKRTVSQEGYILKGLSYEIDFENVDEN